MKKKTFSSSAQVFTPTVKIPLFDSKREFWYFDINFLLVPKTGRNFLSVLVILYAYTLWWLNLEILKVAVTVVRRIWYSSKIDYNRYDHSHVYKYIVWLWTSVCRCALVEEKAGCIGIRLQLCWCDRWRCLSRRFLVCCSNLKRERPVVLRKGALKTDCTGGATPSSH